MYDNISIPTNTDVDALQMVVSLRLRPSLGFVQLFYYLQNDFLSPPDRKINFMSATRKHSTI